MTEKRFIPIFDGIDKRVVGAKDNGVIISFEDMFNLLNELHEENEQLKQELYSYQLLLMDFDFKNVDELRKALEMKIIIQSNVQSYCDVLRKYGIDNAEKLDQVLFNQRVW